MSAVPAPSETGFPMPRKITVLANKPAADAGSGATDFAFLELSETLKRLPDTQITLFGNETFCAPHSFQTNLLAACRQLMASGEANAEKIIASAKNSDALLLGDVRGLSAVEWIPALTLSCCPTPWVFSDWPREFPACDPVRDAARHGTLPRRLIASACLKFAYKSDPTRRDRLTPVTQAIFASEPLRERNRQSFPQLEHAHVIPLPIDTGVFKFKPTNSARARAWGWIGDIGNDSEDAVVALKIFAFEALQNPECRFYIATDILAPAAQKMLARIRAHPALAPRITFLQPPQNNVALAAMLRDFGVLIEPRRRKKSEFPQLISAALACGCLPLCGKDEETEHLLENTPEMLFHAEAPSSAFLLCEKIKAMTPETRTEMLCERARKITENASSENVIRRLLEILDKP